MRTKKKKPGRRRRAALVTPPVKVKPALNATSAAKTVRRQTRERKARFDVAHAKGMKALAEKDYQSLSEAINEESALIDAQTRQTEASARKTR